MKKNILLVLAAFLLGIINVNAQKLTDTQKKAVETVLNHHANGVHTGSFRVDSFVVRNDELQFFINGVFNDVPFRKENCDAIINSLKSIFQSEYPGKNIEVFTRGSEIRELIPRFFQPKNAKGPSFVNHNDIPLVRNLDKPYQLRSGLSGRHITIWQSHGAYFEQGLSRWEWQRARMFETVEDKYTQVYVLQYLIPMLENAGAVVLTPRERDINPYEVVVDNDGFLSVSPYRESNGLEKWSAGPGKAFAYKKKMYTEFDNPFKDGTHRIVETVTKEDDASFAVWTPNIPQDREYAVYVSYQSLPNSSKDARYTIYHKDGKTTFAVNQTMGGGTWIYLGTYRFSKGLQGKVVLTNYSSEKNKIVSADAVRFGGGLGNIGRRADGDSISANGKTDRNTVRKARNAFQPKLNYRYETSAMPRFLEGARYWLQWAGIPDTIYSPSRGTDDYADDYKCRGMWVNYLAGGTKVAPHIKGLNIPIDLSLAFHTDAGTVYGDSIIGTLGIYESNRYNGRFADGTSRMLSRGFCDLMLSTLTNDIRKLYEPKWTRRGMWNSSYYEAWVPLVPAMLLEFLSHENFADLRYGLDPRFHFTAGRAAYKAILKFLADQYGYDYVVQPLPVTDFALSFKKKDEVVLTWKGVSDSLEETAVPKQYIVYKRIGDGDFDNGTKVGKQEYSCKIPVDRVVSFKVTALNDGGESFPSEILSAGVSSATREKPVLVVNGFDRISAPDDYRSADDEQAGFLATQDNGVPYKQIISYVGPMKEFRRAIPWTDDDSGGFGDSYACDEKIIIAGNTFDYPALHGKSLLKAGYSFVSASRNAAVRKAMFDTGKYCVVDLILGKQKQSKMGRGGIVPLQFKTFPDDLQAALTDYCRKGGNVFVSGAYVGTDLWYNKLAKPVRKDLDFARDILKYKWRNNRAALTGAIKSVVSPLTEEPLEFNYHNRPNPESYVVESPDGIEPADDSAYTAFRYSENNLSAGVVFGGTDKDNWRTVVLGFPFESLKSGENRDLLMATIMNYLLR